MPLILIKIKKKNKKVLNYTFINIKLIINTYINKKNKKIIK